MSPTARAVLSSWSYDEGITLGLVAVFALYLRGWFILHRTSPARFQGWRLLVFTAGLTTLWLAIASPLDAFSGLLLSAHMVQHLLLMSVVPPLILLGAPLLPLLRGLPRKFARDGVGPFLTWSALRRAGNMIIYPPTSWLVMAVTLCAWHVPAAFDLALRSPAWHKLEHACFLGAFLLFWWPVIRPFPSRPQWPLWAVPFYLLAADLLNTALSAILTFSEHGLYPTYLSAPRLFGTTALSDQSCAGVIMWVPGSLVFLIPAALIAVQYLSPGNRLVRPQIVPLNSKTSRANHELSGPASVRPFAPRKPSHAAETRQFDLLSLPWIGAFLRARSGRRLMQGVLFAVAAVVILDGLFGPQVSSANLAGVLPWTYWRAFVVIGLLAAGNLFCIACPFTLFRELGRRLGLRQRSWPRALRSKWFAVVLLALFFWAYEVYSLWDKPIWTAWLIINYFLVAFAIDALFSGASFCKYVCPIGQFQFVASLVSPLEVKVRQPDVCVSCKTHDCLRGNSHQRGCEMELYLPRKSGNLDCTFCLDCVRACPHDNVGLLAVAPSMDIVRDPPRSSIGRLSRRRDIAALTLVFVFAAFANAALMVTPISSWRDHIAANLNLSSTIPVTTVLFLFAFVLAPLILIGGSVLAGRAIARVKLPRIEMIGRFSLALVPLASAMWAAHYLFHFLLGWNSVLPVFQRVLSDLGWAVSSQSNSSVAGPPLSMEHLRILQTVLLDVGLLATLYVGWRIARVHAPKLRSAFGVMAPWSSVAVSLYAFGIWTFLQPMQMRGMATNSPNMLLSIPGRGGHRPSPEGLTEQYRPETSPSPPLHPTSVVSM